MNDRIRNVERALWAHRRAVKTYRRCEGICLLRARQASRERDARFWQRHRSLIALRRLAFEAECRALLRELLILRRITDLPRRFNHAR